MTERPRLATAVLLASAAALAAATALRLPSAWATGNALNHVSGSWLSLAVDLSQGTFYRPLFDRSIGAGGTRFFPLLFSIHAAFLKAGADLFATAYLLSLLGGATVALGVYALVRGAGRPPLQAAAFGAVAFAGLAAQQALTAARGDLLPAGLSALGLASVARRRAKLSLPLGALAFVLAFSAKPTALTAVAAAVAFLFLRKERRSALVLCASVMGGALVVLFATNLLSQGRFFSLLWACASSGESPLDLLRGPVRLVRGLVEDPSALLAVLGGLLAAVAALRRAPTESSSSQLVACLWLLAALGGAALVLGSPGTDANHLVETEAAAGAALGTCVGKGPFLVRVLAPASALGGLLVALSLISADGRYSRLGEVRQLVLSLPEGPIFSEDPLVPLVANERPYVEDAFMLRLTSERDPSLFASLRSRLRRGGFGSVVLYNNISDPASKNWYERVHLGHAVVAAIRAGYQVSSTHGRYHVYLPISSTKEVGGDVTTAAACNK